jgi:hypothetical protein
MTRGKQSRLRLVAMRTVAGLDVKRWSTGATRSFRYSVAAYNSTASKGHRRPDALIDAPAVHLSHATDRSHKLAYGRIFGFNKLESVICFSCGLVRLDLRLIILFNRAKFYMHLNKISNLVLNTLSPTLIGMQDS